MVQQPCLAETTAFEKWWDSVETVLSSVEMESLWVRALAWATLGAVGVCCWLELTMTRAHHQCHCHQHGSSEVLLLWFVYSTID